MHTLLIVEDNDDTKFVVSSILSDDYNLAICSTIEEGVRALSEKKFDLILLDVMLPDGDGFQLFEKIRKNKNNCSTPVIFLTGKSDVSYQLLGYTLGAEDYIVKPIHPSVLRAKIVSKLNTIMSQNELKSRQISLGNLLIDLNKQKIYLKEGSELINIDVTPIEFKIIFLFMNNPEKVFTRNNLIELLWPDKINVVERTVDSHISHVRRKLKALGIPQEIESVHRVGYRLKKNPA